MSVQFRGTRNTGNRDNFSRVAVSTCRQLRHWAATFNSYASLHPISIGPFYYRFQKYSLTSFPKRSKAVTRIDDTSLSLIPQGLTYLEDLGEPSSIAHLDLHERTAAPVRSETALKDFSQPQKTIILHEIISDSSYTQSMKTDSELSRSLALRRTPGKKYGDGYPKLRFRSNPVYRRRMASPDSGSG
ncbi:hypothetical protein R1flu_011731 [Riccia fluitans]|uniref:Uncharacterized protein n=1 Tax=Riccia fluitans TaxID=41844 RepID=A0ABD1Z8L7_9MARC